MSDRHGALVRGVVPAVVGLGVFVLGSLVGARLIVSVVDAETVTAAILGSITNAVLYILVIGVAAVTAAYLADRSLSAILPTIDRAWLRDCLGGFFLAVGAIGVALAWGTVRGLRDVSVSGALISGPPRPEVVGLLGVLFLCYFFLGNLSEELIYRQIMFGNFLDGLLDRGLSEQLAILLAAVGSLLVFGLYHIPLRGNVIVAIDAAMSGIPLVLAYLLTDSLGLPVGVHFGRVAIEILYGRVEAGPFSLVRIVDLPQSTLVANLEVKTVRIGLLCLGVLAWVVLIRGDLHFATVRNRTVTDSDS